MRRTRPAPAGLPITLRRIPAAGAPGRARLLAPESLPANGTVPGRWFRCFCGPVGYRKQRIPADGSGNRRTTRNSPPSLEAKNEEGPLRRAFLLPAPELPLPALRAEHGCPAVRFRRFTFNAACRERNRVVRGSARTPGLAVTNRSIAPLPHTSSRRRSRGEVRAQLHRFRPGRSLRVGRRRACRTGSCGGSRRGLER